VPLIRSLEARDRPALQFAFDRLSAESRSRRFLSVKPELSERELLRLLSVDHWHHEALLASAPSPRAPIAVARYVRTQEFDVAEIAVAVVDQWQRQGVGRALMLALRAGALTAGIRVFTATVQHGNRGALALADELGRRSVLATRQGVVELRLEL
jgi:RimJ/RimL family protein N-acetyltransferase